MSRNRTPTAIQDAKGYFQKNPDRKRNDEPDGGEPLGTAPEFLSENQKQLWKEIEETLCAGVAKKSDRISFEILVRLLERERNLFILPAERAQLISLFSRFGMTPSDRAKISVPVSSKSSLDDFLSEEQGHSVDEMRPEMAEKEENKIIQ